MKSQNTIRFLRKVAVTAAFAVLLAACAATATILPVSANTPASAALIEYDATKFTVTAAPATYAAKALTTTVTVKYGETTLEENTDYTLSYENNVFVGTAKVTVTFIGNYSGKCEQTFNIGRAVGVLSVSWQKREESGRWSTLAANTEVKYGDEENIRARLTLMGDVDHTEYVYCKDSKEKRDNNLVLKFGTKDEMEALDTMEITIDGTPNYLNDSNNNYSGTPTLSIKAVKRTVTFEDNDFNCLIDENGTDNRLWGLSFASGDKFAPLLDKTTYYANNKNNEGAEIDAYARFRDENLDLKLNGNYEVDGKPLGWFIRNATVSYTHKDKNDSTSVGLTRGNRNADTEVKTTTVLTFDGNKIDFTPKERNNYSTTAKTLTLKKTWHIVTPVNVLRAPDGNKNISIPSWTFGKGETIASPRPEHGGKVIWTLEAKDGHIVKRFATVFDESAEKTYNVKSEANGIYQPDLTSRLDKGFSNILGELSADTYKLKAYVPEFDSPANEEHQVWWDENGKTDIDYGCKYNQFTAEYDFTVEKYNLSTATDELINVEIRGTHYYVGSAITLEEDLTVYFNRKALIPTEDYTLLYANNTAAGENAAVTVIGSGNFTGEITKNFEIRKISNSWVSSPSIIRWMYGTFNRDINLLLAQPAYPLDNPVVTFKIAKNVNGAEVVEGLENFTLETNADGVKVVSAAVATKLNELGAGKYYLFASVPETASYFALSDRYEFTIEQAKNHWADVPNVIHWSEGAFDKTVNKVIALPVYGKPTDVSLVVKDSDGSVVFTSDMNIQRLGLLPAGEYSLTATVESTPNYSGLTSTIKFRIFENEDSSAGVMVALIVFSIIDGLLLVLVVIAYVFGRAHTNVFAQRQLIAAKYNAAKADMQRLQAPAENKPALDAPEQVKEKPLGIAAGENTETENKED